MLVTRIHYVYRNSTYILNLMSGPILITGASGGIGRELARLHSCECDHLILLGRTEEHLDALKEELLNENKHLTIDVLAKDLSKPGAADEVYALTKEAGIKPSYLINNAGFGDFGEFVNSKWNKIEHMMYLNMMTVTRLTQLYAKDMVAEGHGRIMNVASTGAFMPGPLMAVYYATKAYVLHFSEALNNELEGTGVTVTALCPGPTLSGFQMRAGIDEGAFHIYKYSATPKEVADFGYKAMLKGKAVAIHRFRNRIWVFLVRLAPRALIVKIMRRILEKRRT